jgi:hypothetical protein
VEIMLGNPPVKALIREGKIYQLPNVIRTHRDIGMISMDEALVSLYLRRVITGESLLEVCNDKKEVEKLIGKVCEIRVTNFSGEILPLAQRNSPPHNLFHFLEEFLELRDRVFSITGNSHGMCPITHIRVTPAWFRRAET